MVNMMSAELLATIIGIALAVITLVITIYLTNRATQKILKGHEKILSEIACAIGKIRADTKASAWREGYLVAENIESEEECKKLSDTYFYDPATKVCHYKPKKSATA